MNSLVNVLEMYQITYLHEMNNNNNNNNLSSFLVNKFIANFGKKMYKNDCLFACLGLSDFLYEEKAFKLREEEEEEEEG